MEIGGSFQLTSVNRIRILFAHVDNSIERSIILNEQKNGFGAGQIVFDKASLIARINELSSSQEGTRVVEISLRTAKDFRTIREIWTESNARTNGITLCIRVGTVPIPGGSPRQLIADLCNHADIELQNKLEKLIRVFPGQSSTYFLSRPPLVWPRNSAAMLLSSDPYRDLFRRVQDQDPTTVVFLKSSDDSLSSRIPRDFWKILFSTNIPSVLQLGDSIELEPLRLFPALEASTLFVFPERMLPLQRAYFVRGFDFLLGLNYAGHPCNALVLGPNNSDLHRIQSALEIICPNVFAHPLVRGDWHPHHRIVRSIERSARRLAGHESPAPIRFSERCQTFATARNRMLVGAALQQQPSTKSVIYTGAWFTQSVLPLREQYPNIKWFCDTHDVFFLMDRHANAEEARFLYSERLQKKLEIGYLNRIDGVITISDADNTTLTEGNCRVPIITEHGSFSHAMIELQEADADTLLAFGFIGSNNANNARCLDLIRGAWWPRVLDLAPAARLKIAGTICRSPEAAALKDSFQDSVELVGFVKTIRDFYSSVSAMLSPITVQGGLNFKSVEALMAGVPLLTNEMGTKCLGASLKGVLVIGENCSGIEDALRLLQFPDKTEELRKEIQDSAEKRFGNHQAYTNLISKLRALENSVH